MDRPDTGEWLVRRVLQHPEVVAEAERMMTGDSSLGSRLAARRLIENGTEHEGEEYHWSAYALRSGGYEREAAVLEQVTVTEDWIRRAEVRWEHRYQGAADPATAARRTPDAGLIEPTGTQLRGVDGALYQEGRRTVRPAPVVIVSARGMTDIVGGFSGRDDARRWMASRRPGTPGPLRRAPAGSATWTEEQVLAYMMTHPESVPPIAASLGGHVFGQDVRDEIYRAVLATAVRPVPGGPSFARRAADEVAARYAWAPAWARRELGGPSAPWMRDYVSRIARTEVSHGEAVDAVTRLQNPGPLPEAIAAGRVRAAPALPARSRAEPGHIPGPRSAPDGPCL